MQYQKLLADLAATYQFASELAAQIKPGQTVYLYGDLGAGKTSLVQGLLKAWGFQGDVTSPTFTLVEPYHFANFNVFHFDFYRLQQPGELEYIGIKEYFTANSICLIEWPEQAGRYIPKANWIIELQYEQNGRSVRAFTQNN